MRRHCRVMPNRAQRDGAIDHRGARQCEWEESCEAPRYDHTAAAMEAGKDFEDRVLQPLEREEP
jgi:hypothetical protein